MKKDIHTINKKLTPEFKLIQKNDSLYMYLNNNQLGKYYTNCDQFDIENLTVFCHFSEIKHLISSILPKNITFFFSDTDYYDPKHSEIFDNLCLSTLVKLNKEIQFSFLYRLELTEYKDSINPVLLYNTIENLENFEIEENEIENGTQFLYFSYKVDNEINNLEYILDNTKNILLNTYNNEVLNLMQTNSFEAIFNFPEQYQSILKPYLLYFEEFLNDLCIETDVNIQKVGLDTILSVEPKNKDEALDNIADALKAYLCAPVISNGISMEESFQMQTSLTKLNAQCKHLESQMMYKEISLREQNQQIELKDNIINESKRVLIEAGVDTNIITHNNTMLLESLKSINIKDKKIEKKPFINSIKGALKIPFLFKGNFELEMKK